MKKRTTLAAVLLAVLFGMTAFAAPLTETVESGAEVSDMSAAAHKTESENATLNAGEIPSPGINILTGTSEAETFGTAEGTYTRPAEATSIKSFGVSGGSASIVLEDERGGVLKVTETGTAYPDVVWTLSSVIEADRPVYISLAAKNQTRNMWFGGFARNGITANSTENMVYNPTPLYWHNVDHNKINMPLPKANTWAEYKIALSSVKDMSQLFIRFDKKTGEILYLDDLSFIPYYKVTYYSPDGNDVLHTEYTLIDAKGNFLTSYEPNFTAYEGAFRGWATTKNGEIVNSVELAHKDISLYAIVDETKIAKIVYEANKPALADTVSDMPAVGYAVIGKENTLSAAPTAKYFSFKGWSLEQKELAAYTDSDILKTVTPESADDITLYAVWDYDYTADSMLSLEFDESEDILANIFKDVSAGAYADISFTEKGYVAFQANKDIPKQTHPTYSVSLTAKYPNGVPVEFNRAAFRGKRSLLNTVQPYMCLTADKNRSLGLINNENVYSLSAEKDFFEKSGSVTNVTGTLTLVYLNPLRASQPMVTDIEDSAFVDYIRFYRTGDKTVTYHLNDGSGNTFKVDDKAAVGVGYRLTGEVPTRDGFEFRGWTTSEADAKTETNLLAPSAAIDIVNADVDLYACWLDKRPSSLGIEFDEEDIETLLPQLTANVFSTRTFKDGLLVITTTETKTANVNNYQRYQLDLSGLALSNDYNRAAIRAKVAQSSNQYLMQLSNFDLSNQLLFTTGSSANYLTFGKTSDITGNNAANYVNELAEKQGDFKYANLKKSKNTDKDNIMLVDILRSGYTAGDTALIDYIRFYRTGDKTVTYYLNDGTENTFKVDTKAAVGVDYRLTGDEPTRDGYDFVGWSTSAYATATVTSIDITNISDNDLYAVWQPSGNTVPTMFENLNSVRVTGNSGIRFAATVALSAKYNDNTEEIGFIIGRKDKLSENDSTLSNLVFGEDGPQDKGYTPDGNKYVYGMVYNKAENINLVYDNNGSKLDGIEGGVSEGVTCVVYNIKNEKTELAVRSYIKIGGSYSYSSAVSRSMYQVAESLNANYDKLSDAEKAWVDKVLGTTGGTTNE